MIKIVFLWLIVGLFTALSGSVYAGLNDGLIAYYPFNGNANDEGGNENDGVINGATLTSDRFGNIDSALSFDGSDDYISYQVEDFPLGNSPVIITGWFKTTDTGGNNGWNGNAIFSYGNPNIHLAVYGGGFIIHSRENNFVGPYIRTENIFVADGDSHFFVYEYQDNAIKLFNDTELIVDEDQDFSTNSYPFQVAIRKFNPYFYFNGVIDDIRIYDRSLSENEILELYHGPLILTIPETAEEDLGILVGQGMINIDYNEKRDLIINLSSDDTSEVTVPDAVTIPVGSTSAVFDITIKDDSEIDGLQTATITAAASYYTVTATIAVDDDDQGAGGGGGGGGGCFVLTIKQ